MFWFADNTTEIKLMENIYIVRTVPIVCGELWFDSWHHGYYAVCIIFLKYIFNGTTPRLNQLLVYQLSKH